MNPSLEPDALYAKSQVYIVRGFRARAAGDFEEYQLWASLSLELLGKAALANVHPALIADPQHYQSLFAACGRRISPDVKTIIAKTLFPRLGHIDKSFDTRRQNFCEQMSLRRNAELHSGESPFSGMKPELWEPEFWGTIVVMLEMQKQNLEAWLGAENAKAPAELIERAKQARAFAVADRIKRARDDFEAKYKNPAQREKVVDAAKSYRWWQAPDDYRLDADEASQHECPACGAVAQLLGTLWNEEVIDEHYDEDGCWETVAKDYSVEEFICPACRLHLYGTDEIAAAALPESFTENSDRVREFEEEYMNE